MIAFSLDELIVLNASRENKNIYKFAETLRELVDDVFIPIAAGGGIRTVNDAKVLFENGADKLVINSILYDDPGLVRKLVKLYGSQSLIASIDYKVVKDEIKVFIRDGQYELDVLLEEYIKNIEGLGVGELYLNSIDQDGTGFGYDFDIIDKVSENISIPIIIAGGAGNEEHLIQGLQKIAVDAVATANLFNFIGSGLPNARDKIVESNINIARWS